MRQVEKMIPHAWEILNEEFPNGTVPKQFKGYIASFGASILQSGLLPTMAFFANRSDRAEANRDLVPKMIVRLVAQQYGSEKLDIKTVDSLAYSLAKRNDRQYKDRVLQASVAFKLALRSFADQAPPEKEEKAGEKGGTND